MFKDVFVFCSYTGLAHVDVGNLTFNNIAVGIDGKKWINTFREKTNERCNIPLLSGALAILGKYQSHTNIGASAYHPERIVSKFFATQYGGALSKIFACSI